MTDENETRPNANYNLSSSNKENKIEEEKLTFYYSRERRLAKAPQTVRDLYNTDKKQSRFNLLRPLIADKPRATLFFSIVMMSVMILFISLLGFADKYHLLEGNKLEISGTKYEGVVIIVVKKNINSKKSNYFGPVDIAVSPIADAEEEYPIFYHRIMFNPVQEEEYRFVVPFDSPELAMVFQTESNTLKLRFKPD